MLCRSAPRLGEKRNHLAMELKKNIIPVMLEGFEYPAELTESMKDFDKYHALSCNLQDFSYVMERITAMMK